MIQVTMREWTILTFVEQYMDANGRSPTFREIQDGTGIPSTATVWSLLGSMEAAGLLTWKRFHNRTIILHKQRVGVALS